MSAHRCTCPDCGATHPKRSTTPPPRRSAATNTDLDVTTCPLCRAPVLAGRIGGLDTHLDPQPVNELGWRTYHAIGRTIYRRRDTRATRANPTTTWPPDRDQYFHIAHECGKPIPEPLIENNTTRNPERTIEFPDNPPY